MERRTSVARPEPAAGAYLWEENAASVARFAAFFTRSRADAEDLAQEALYRALRNLGQYEPTRGPLAAWLWRIVANTARDASRREALWSHVLGRLTQRVASSAPSAEEEVLARVSDSEIAEALKGLSPRDRLLLSLRYGADLSTQGVGDALGLSAVAAQKAIRRALDRLRARLEGAKT